MDDKTTLIKNADWIITMDEKRNKYRHGDIVICGKRIIKIGYNLEEELIKRKIDYETIDAHGKMIIPGFVNVHHHTWQSLVRNIKCADGLRLEPWLKTVYEVFKDINYDVSRAGAYTGLGDLLKSGCTTSNDLFYAHPVGVKNLIDAEIDVASELGIRFHPNRGSHSKQSDIVPKELVGSVDEVIEDSERLIKKYHDKKRFSMCKVGIAPNMPQYEKVEMLEATKTLAEKYDVLIHGHLAESVYETQYTMETFGCRPVEWFRRHDLLGPRFYYAHCVHLNDEEIKIMKNTNTGIAHCPISNMFLNSGVCRVKDLLNEGVERIGLGVDGAASSNSSNFMEELRCAYLVNRLTFGYESANPEDYLYLATVGGAKVLGRDDIGYLSENMAADITMLEWNELQYAGGCNNPVDCIVLSGDARMVSDVMVNGKIVVKNHKLVNVDEKKISKYVNEVGKNLLTEASTRCDALLEDI